MYQLRGKRRRGNEATGWIKMVDARLIGEWGWILGGALVFDMVDRLVTATEGVGRSGGIDWRELPSSLVELELSYSRMGGEIFQLWKNFWLYYTFWEWILVWQAAFRGSLKCVRTLNYLVVVMCCLHAAYVIANWVGPKDQTPPEPWKLRGVVVLGNRVCRRIWYSAPNPIKASLKRPAAFQRGQRSHCSRILRGQQDLRQADGPASVWKTSRRGLNPKWDAGRIRLGDLVGGGLPLANLKTPCQLYHSIYPIFPPPQPHPPSSSTFFSRVHLVDWTNPRSIRTRLVSPVTSVSHSKF
jgi:hypothetical protein